MCIVFCIFKEAKRTTMNENQKKELHQEKKHLKLLLDFHIKYRERTLMSKKEFDDYVNAALERISEINKILEDKK